jgi:hypothetical protein
VRSAVRRPFDLSGTALKQCIAPALCGETRKCGGCGACGRANVRSRSAGFNLLDRCCGKMKWGGRGCRCPVPSARWPVLSAWGNSTPSPRLSGPRCHPEPRRRRRTRILITGAGVPGNGSFAALRRFAPAPAQDDRLCRGSFELGAQSLELRAGRAQVLCTRETSYLPGTGHWALGTGHWAPATDHRVNCR